ncbi:hypothetical protein RUND412_008679 [Rhizina undulata]
MDSTSAFNPALFPFTSSLPSLLAQTPHLNDIAVGAFIFNHPTHSPAPVPDAPLQLLVLRRAPTESFPNRWEVPGGGVEAPPVDASILHGLVREVLEETGLSVRRVVREIVPWLEFGASRGLRCRKFNFEVEVEEVEAVTVDPAEHTEWRWVGLGELGEIEFTTEEMKACVREALEKKRSEMGAEGGR